MKFLIKHDDGTYLSGESEGRSYVDTPDWTKHRDQAMVFTIAFNAAFDGVEVTPPLPRSLHKDRGDFRMVPLALAEA